MCLAGVLQASGNTLHGQDEGILQTGGVVTRRVQLHELIGRVARLHDLLRDVRPQLHIVGWVSDPFECVCLANV